MHSNKHSYPRTRHAGSAANWRFGAAEAEVVGLRLSQKGAPHSLHDLRRSFSTLAQRAGVDKYTVKDLGDWSVVSVVEKHYTGDVQEVHRRAMDRIAGTA